MVLHAKCATQTAARASTQETVARRVTKASTCTNPDASRLARLVRLVSVVSVLTVKYHVQLVPKRLTYATLALITSSLMRTNVNYIYKIKNIYICNIFF